MFFCFAFLAWVIGFGNNGGLLNVEREVVFTFVVEVILSKV